MLETEIKNLTQAVTENTEKMAELIAAMASGATGTAEEPKSKAKPKPKKKAEPQPEPEVEEETPETDDEAEEATHTAAELKAKFGELSKAKTGAAVKKLLKSHGFDKFSDVPENDPVIDVMYAEAEKQAGV